MDGMDRIKKVIAELRALGYYTFQIEEMIMEKTGTIHLGKLNQATIDELVGELEEQVRFARKCKNTTINVEAKM